MKNQMVLGDFVFSISNHFAYEGFVRKSGGGWVELNLLNQKPLTQNTGQPLETIEIRGKVFGQSASEKLEQLRQMQNQRKPYQLLNDEGLNLKQWTIENLTETQSRILSNGQAQVLNFSLSLKEFVSDAAS